MSCFYHCFIWKLSLMKFKFISIISYSIISIFIQWYFFPNVLPMISINHSITINFCIRSVFFNFIMKNFYSTINFFAGIFCSDIFCPCSVKSVCNSVRRCVCMQTTIWINTDCIYISFSVNNSFYINPKKEYMDKWYFL